ncbi:hypothetical protein GW17_00042930, partial [Ensete ventricosum]
VIVIPVSTCASGLRPYLLLPPRSLSPFTVLSHTPASLIFFLRGSQPEAASTRRRPRKALSEPYFGIGFFEVRPVDEEGSAGFVVRQEPGGAGPPRRGDGSSDRRTVRLVTGVFRPAAGTGAFAADAAIGPSPLDRIPCGTAPWPKTSTTRPISSTKSMLVVARSIGREKHLSMV